MQRLSLAAYAAPALPMAMLGLPLYAYVPKLYAELPMIGLGLAGLALFVSRLFDLASDPLMGWLVDRVRQRIHPLVWVVLGVPVTLAGVWYLFDPRPGAGVIDLLLAAGLTYLGWTLVSVPYYAWGAELARDDGGRRRVAAWREAAVLAGALLALVAAALPGAEGPLVRMAWLMSVLLPLCVALTFFVPGPGTPVRYRPHGRPVPWRGLTRPMRRLVGLHFLNALAAGIPATLFLMFAEQRLGLQVQQSGWLLLLYFASGILALPLWLGLASRLGDARAWGVAAALAAVAFLPAAWLGPGDLAGFALICLVTGATLGADIALPAALQARLANRESRAQGRPREGSAFGLFGMAGKLALAFAVGISLPLLQLFDDGGAANAVLPWFYASAPAVIKIAVAVAIFRSIGVLNGHSHMPAEEGIGHETNESIPGGAVRSAAGRVQ